MEQVVKKHKPNILYLIVKRLFDIIIGILGFVILIPITIFVKIAYILSGDFYPIFYSHKRVGKNGKIFRLIKFRTMVPKADKVLDDLLKDPLYSEEYDKNKKIKDDPRITKVGKILRKASLDETPQFLNILLGQMSLVGNRPYLPREIEDMGQYYEDIVKTKPGLTGYWQVSGRSDVSFKKRLELEKYYSNNYSLKLDIKIIFKTIAVVLGAKGAN